MVEVEDAKRLERVRYLPKILDCIIVSLYHNRFEIYGTIQLRVNNPDVLADQNQSLLSLKESVDLRRPCDILSRAASQFLNRY